ncbi:hypothetical protein C1645_836337 [Glomus cerebriforme]|uniref:Uncharacterized protein n=1 Tax=Glomus cerebriforme TaxID=658196 RepID=A0A397SGB4_9GLOM|nr:hypothetical protein C1645_836337 [Glomus cerebriforme]
MWYLKSAIAGCAKGQCNLGDCYRLGKGIDKDEAKAVEWYFKSAEGGNKIAQSKMEDYLASGYNMNLVVANLENGIWVSGFNTKCKPQTDPLKNGQSEVFSSAASSSYYGFRGFITFTIDDDISSTFTISWYRTTSRTYDSDYTFEFLPNKYEVNIKRYFKGTTLQVTVLHQATDNSMISFILILMFIVIPFYCHYFLFKKDAFKNSSESRLRQIYNSI